MNIASIHTKGSNTQGVVSGNAKPTEEKKVSKADIKSAVITEGVQVSEGVEPADAGTYSEIMEKKAEEAREEKAQEEKEEDLKETSERMSEDDYLALAEEGMSLEHYETGRLDRALKRIKDNKEFRTENVTEQVKERRELRETIEKVAIANKISDPVIKKIAQKLADADLPVTEENILSLVNAMSMTGAVSSLSEGGTAYLIENELAPTVENIYQSQYSGYQAGGTGEAGWEVIQQQAAAVLEKAGIEVNEETIGQAKWLYDNHLPITGDSMKALQTIENIKENADPDFIMEKMAEAMGKGLEPGEANLDESSQKIVEEAIQEFDQLPEDFYKSLDFKDLDEVTFKRQLEEVRLKLTTEAGLKLLNKGITLDTSNLQKIVEGLREIEDQYYKEMLKEAGVSSTDQSASLLKDTALKVEALKEAPSYVLGATIDHHGERNLEELHTEAIGMKVRLDKAEETYEALMTAPRKDMGDSITKAFRNVDDILQDMGLETTSANQRAVRILGYNQMEITDASIQAVKEYDSKVNLLLDQLKPAVTVELIRRDLNPLEVPLDELTEQVKAIQEEIGATDEEKYSKFLWKLEKEDGITPEERKSYIGIYRLLNNVEKTNGAAIGAVVNNGMELTLKNLLTAARSRKSQGMNIEVDESFGMAESVTFEKESITDQIDAGFVQYQQEVIRRIMDNISPDKLNQLTKDGVNGLMDLTLEKMEDKLEQVIEDNRNDREYAFEMTEKLRSLAKTSKEAVQLLDSYEVEATIRNVSATAEFFTGSKNIFKELDEIADNEYSEMIAGLPDALEDAKTMQDKYEQVEAKVKQLIDDEYKNQVDTSNRADRLQLFSAGIALARRLSRSEHYEIPVMTGEQVTKMSLTVLEGTNESGKLHITMDSEALGRAEAEFSVKYHGLDTNVRQSVPADVPMKSEDYAPDRNVSQNGQVGVNVSEQTINGFILCETKDGLETIEGCMRQLEGRLSSIGLKVGQISAGMAKKAGTGGSVPQEASSGQTGTNILYQAAKAVVQTIGTAIQNTQN